MCFLTTDLKTLVYLTPNPLTRICHLANGTPNAVLLMKKQLLVKSDFFFATADTVKQAVCVMEALSE